MAWPATQAGAVEQRASVAAARGIGQRGPTPFVHPIGGHEVEHGLGRGRGNVRVIQAQIPGAIHRADAVAVAGAGGQARIAMAVGAGGGDLGKGGAACPLTALHPVAGQAAPAAVGRGGPSQSDLTAASRHRGQPGRIGWGNRVGRWRLGGGGGHVRVGHTDIRGGIDGLHAVAVGGGGDQARVAERGTGGRGDLYEGGAAHALTALHAIAGDAHIIGGRSPTQVELGGTYGRGG